VVAEGGNGANRIDRGVVGIVVVTAFEDSNLPWPRSFRHDFRDGLQRDVAGKRASSGQNVETHGDDQLLLRPAMLPRAARMASRIWGKVLKPVSLFRCPPPEITSSGACRWSAISFERSSGT
jgi:hypothetical protein